MNRLLCILFVAVSLASLSFTAPAQEPKPQPKSEKAPLVVEPVKPAAKPATTATARRGVSVRDARRLGITLLSVRSHRKALVESGDIDESTSRAEKASLVLERISADNHAAFGEQAGIDLDSLLSFIESLIELIERPFSDAAACMPLDQGFDVQLIAMSYPVPAPNYSFAA